MKSKSVKISNKDIASYVKSREREGLLDAFITQDTSKLIKDISKWNDTQRVLGYLDAIIRFNADDREVFYEHSLLSNRGDMVSACTVCGVALYSTRKGFMNIRSQIKGGKDLEEISENSTILSIYATLKSTQQQYYKTEKRDWVNMVQSNLNEKSKSGPLSREEREIFGFVNNILR